MAYNERLAQRIGEIVGDYDGVTSRKMFGGIAFMLNGNMCCGVVGDDLMVRVGSEAHDAALAQPGARPMDFTGRPMKGMVYVDAENVTSPEELMSWVQRGIEYAGSLPAK